MEGVSVYACTAASEAAVPPPPLTKSLTPPPPPPPPPRHALAGYWNPHVRAHAAFLTVAYIMGNLALLFFGMKSKLLVLGE